MICATFLAFFDREKTKWYHTSNTNFEVFKNVKARLPVLETVICMLRNTLRSRSRTEIEYGSVFAENALREKEMIAFKAKLFSYFRCVLPIPLWPRSSLVEMIHIHKVSKAFDLPTIYTHQTLAKLTSHIANSTTGPET